MKCLATFIGLMLSLFPFSANGQADRSEEELWISNGERRI